MVHVTGTGNNLDSVRRHNLAAVLGLVHVRGPLSRSELTAATGLNRSTIGMLAGELAALGLVTENGPGERGGVGRPSPVVAANGEVVVLAVNPEIDAVTVGVVGLDGALRHRLQRSVDEPPSAADAVEIIASLVGELAADLAACRLIAGIGVAVPGLVREADGVVRLAPHLAWTEEPFARMLHEATGLPVSVANDAHLGANAELLFGAGKGVSDLVYLNGGASGIGGGVITDRRPLTGRSGYAGELGHTLVNSSGVRCSCGLTGCLETEVRRDLLLAAVGLEQASEDELDRAILASSCRAVRLEVERQTGFLAVALRTATTVFDPGLIVLGGFLGTLLDAAGDRLTGLVAGPSQLSGESPRIVRAGLGSRLLLIGAAELAFRPLLADPASAAERT